MARSLNRLTVAGAALAAAGLLAIPPAVAYAHTDDAFTMTYVFPGPTPTGTPEVAFLAIDRDSADVAQLPEIADIYDAGFPLGIEILDEQGYVLQYLFDELEVDGLPVVVGLGSWDHDTGEIGASAPLTIADSAFETGGGFEGFDAAIVQYAKLLDATPDGELLTVAGVVLAEEVEGELEETGSAVVVLSIDPESGESVPVASFEFDTAYAALFFSTGLATDPVGGTTWLFLTDLFVTSDEVSVLAEAAEPTVYAFEIPLDGDIAIDTSGALADFEALAEGVDATAVDLTDLETFPGPPDALGEGALIGADFDADGSLWFQYLTELGGLESLDDLEIHLASAEAPFSLDSAVTDAGVLAWEENWYPIYSGPVGLNGVFALESTAEDEESDEELAPTGIDGLAPAGAAAVALLGGVLLLLGRRRTAS